MQTLCRIVILISGNGSNLQAIANSVEVGQCPALISAVISNKANAKGLTFALSKGIHTQVVDHTQHPDRSTFDAELIKAIDQYNPQLVVLAGFMRILTEGFVKHYMGRLVNIHPSLLPKYRGLHTHHQALQAQDTEHGCTVHFVTPDLDGGPIIIQASIPITTDMSEEILAQKVQKLEHQIYPLAIQWFANQRLHLNDGQVYLDNHPLPSNGYRYHEIP